MTLASSFWVVLRLVTLVAAVCALAAPADANDDEVALFEAAKEQPPMEFFVARGGPDACGVGCDHWIAAEGRIVRDSVGPDGRPEEGTTARLVSLLGQLGAGKLPLFFHSPGGDIIESLALGRALRAWELTAGVATTLPANCPASTVDECRKLMRAHPEAEARLWSEGVPCNSGCSYAVLGAVTREIAPAARIGVHSFLVDPNATAIRRAATKVAAEQGIQRYLADMGIDVELYKIAMAVDVASSHVLSRSELYDLGIDRRETIDSGWILGNVDSRKGFMVFATVAKITAVGHESTTTFNRISLAIACYLPRRRYLIILAQPLPNALAKTKSDFRVSAGAAGVALDGGTSLLTTEKNGVFQLWREPATRGMVETLLTSPTIKVSEAQRRDKARKQTAGDPPPEFLFSNVRGREALKTIVSRCAEQK